MNTSLVQQVPEEVICIAGNAIDRQPQNGGNGSGVSEDLAYTLTATDRHSVFARQRVDVFQEEKARMEKRMAEMDKEIADKDKKLADKDNELAELRAEIARLKGSDK